MADHPRSSEQQEADAAASKGCGMFDFLKKKPEDVHSSENATGVTKDNKEEEKPSLAERLHLSDSSSSDEEAGENGEKKEKKNKKKKEDAADQCKAEEKIKEKLPAGISHDQAKAEHEDGKEKGVVEKMKDKLPGGGQHGKPEPETHHENGKEKGFMDKIKEKLPGHNTNDDEKKKET